MPPLDCFVATLLAMTNWGCGWVFACAFLWGVRGLEDQAASRARAFGLFSSSFTSARS
jgi:hypothetical protein